MRRFIYLVMLSIGWSIPTSTITPTNQWIRINQLGYPTGSIKVAVWCSKDKTVVKDFELVDAKSKQVVFKQLASEAYGAYGPFENTCRLDFSKFVKPGTYFLRSGNVRSPVFPINNTVYKGAADFCLKYMRQQRSGFNPFLKDSCHTHDGYTVYAPVPDGTTIDASGGWHDASDYLQYAATSANATYHLLAAYRDFPQQFTDTKLANGLDGKNGMADVFDEAKWGLDWLLKMHPKKDWLFNQIADDRDHRSMRIPKEDSFYNKGYERPVYFITGKPQGLFKYKNRATGAASTAGKFASAFALGYQLLKQTNPNYAKTLYEKSVTAYQIGIDKPGVAQTAPGGAPYFYEEDDWKDDMALAGTQLFRITKNKKYLDSGYHYLSASSKFTWMGKDTARHYQYYPFHQMGTYELAKIYGHPNMMSTETMLLYENQIYNVWQKAKHNAFFRGVPFTWCSNNLTTSFAIQCYWFKRFAQDATYAALEQANFDWLFGCNPWGTSMVYGLPAIGDTPIDPHSAFTHLKNYPIDGGLVDGPVYTSIYQSLLGIQLKNVDSYAAFQSDLAVYHDDYGDYSTNEPTMDGTASLVYLLAAKSAEATKPIIARKTDSTVNGKTIIKTTPKIPVVSHGAIIRGDVSRKELALVFTGDEYGEGLSVVVNSVGKNQVPGSFFFTGRFYRNPLFKNAIDSLYKQWRHYLGAHSDQHLLYCDWTKRDSLLVSRVQFQHDYTKNRTAIAENNWLDPGNQYFIPPYEWWNDAVAKWCNEIGITILSNTPGTYSNADYTWPEMGSSYKSSETILKGIRQFEATDKHQLNGVVLLIHVGTDPRRKDKLYDHLDELIAYLKQQGYQFKNVADLLH